MEYILFLFIFAGDPDAGAVPTLVNTVEFDNESACESAAGQLRDFVREYAAVGEAIGAETHADIARFAPEALEWGAMFLAGHHAKTLCIPRG